MKPGRNIGRRCLVAIIAICASATVVTVNHTSTSYSTGMFDWISYPGGVTVGLLLALAVYWAINRMLL